MTTIEDTEIPGSGFMSLSYIETPPQECIMGDIMLHAQPVSGSNTLTNERSAFLRLSIVCEFLQGTGSLLVGPRLTPSGLSGTSTKAQPHFIPPHHRHQDAGGFW